MTYNQQIEPAEDMAPKVLKKDAEQTCLDILTLIEDISALLANESKFIRQGSIRFDEAMTTSKSALVRDYQTKCQWMIDNLSAIKGLVPTMVERLGFRQEEFEQQLVAHQQNVAAIHGTTIKLVREVAGRVSQASQPKLYSPYPSRAASAPAQATALMVNRKI